YDDDTGLCTQQTQSYECERTSVTCDETEAICQEGHGELFGGKCNQVMAAESKANALFQMAKREGSDFTYIRLMPGKPVDCHEQLYGDPIAAKCCNDDADDMGLFGECNEDEQDLAAAKRAKRTHKIGRYCSHEINLGITTICTQHKTPYCQFNSLLA